MFIRNSHFQPVTALFLLCFSMFSIAEGFRERSTEQDAGNRCTDEKPHYLRLSSVASTASEKIFLRDLLIGSDIPEFLWDIDKVFLGEFGDHTERRLLKNSITKSVKGLPGADCIKFLGPESILVRRQKVDGVNMEKVTLRATSFLMNEIQSRFETENLSLSLPQREQTAVVVNVPENAKLQFRWASSEKLSTTEFVWVDWKDRDRLLMSSPIKFAVSGSVSVQVMSAEVSRHNQVFKKHLITALVPITDRPVEAVFDLDAEEAKRYVRNLNIGDVLNTNDIEPLPAVVMGGFVTLRTNSQQVSIQALMVAMHDGAIGDVIRLSSPTSEDYIKAKVVGRNLALAIN